MSIEMLSIIAIAVLFIMFFIGAVKPINIGVMGFVAAFIVGVLVCGLSEDDVLASFPAELFIILAGVTYFFNTLQDNGTIDVITTAGLRLVRGNVGLIPWVMFVLELILCAVGTQGTAAIIIVTPIAMQLANACGMSQLMVALMVAFGMTGGIFSPLNIMGLVVDGVLSEYSIASNPAGLWIATVAFSFALALITFIIFGGYKFLGTKKLQDITGIAGEEHKEILEKLNKKLSINAFQSASLVALVVLVFLGIVFEFNMGFLAIILGFILGCTQPKRQGGIIKSMPWSIIFMVSGIVTYVGVMQDIGVMDWLTQLISTLNSPKLATLLTAYIGGFVSAFVSTTGFLSGVIPLCIPVLEEPGVWQVGVLACICMASSIVDVCPFSTTGAIFVANAQGKEKSTLYNHLLYAAACIVLFGPLLAWLVFVAFI